MKKTQILMLIGLIFVTAFVFYPVLNAGFMTLDDKIMIEGNWKIHSFSAKNVKAMLFEPHYKMYHPLVNLSFAAEYALAGESARLYHSTNLILHLFNILLVFFIFMMLTKENFFVSFITAFIFACHPMHVEAVAWISARKDVLYSFFFLSSLFTYLRAFQSGEKKNLYIAVSLFLFLFACLSKSMAVTLPAVLVLCDCFCGRLDKKAVYRYIPFFIAALFFAALTYALYYNPEQKSSFNAPLMLKNILFVHFYYLFYLVKFICPSNLAVLYPYFSFTGIMKTYIIVAPVICYALLFFVLYSLKYTKKVFFAFAFFTITILPVINIFPTGIAPVADRYSYVPFAGFAYILAVIIVFIYKKSGKTYIKAIVSAAVAAIFAVMCVQCHARVEIWHSSKTLLDDQISKYPGQRAQIYSARSIYYEEEEVNPEKQERDVLEAYRIEPENTNTIYALASLRKSQKKYGEALELFEKIKPNDINYHLAAANISDIHTSMGNREKAEEALLEAVKYAPNEFILYYKLGILYKIENNSVKAEENLKKAKELLPVLEDAYILLADIYAGRNEIAAAEKNYLEGLSFAGRTPKLLKGLAVLYFNARYFDEAEKLFKELLIAAPDDYVAYDCLGSISYLKKDYKTAFSFFEKAIAANAGYPDVYFHRGLAYMAAGDMDSAGKDMKQAQSLGMEIPQEIKNTLKAG